MKLVELLKGRGSKAVELTTAAIAFIGLLSAFVVSYIGTGELVTRSGALTEEISALNARMDQTRARIDGVTQKVNEFLSELRFTIERFVENPEGATSLAISELRADLSVLQSRLSSLEGTIVDNAEEAVSLVILRERLSAVRENILRQKARIADEIIEFT